MLKRFFQLDSTAADIFQILAQQADIGIDIKGGSRLRDLLPIDQNFSGEDQGLGALARWGETTLKDQLVEPLLQNASSLSRS